MFIQITVCALSMVPIVSYSLEQSYMNAKLWKKQFWFWIYRQWHHSKCPENHKYIAGMQSALQPLETVPNVPECSISNSHNYAKVFPGAKAPPDHPCLKYPWIHPCWENGSSVYLRCAAAGISRHIWFCPHRSVQINDRDALPLLLQAENKAKILMWIMWLHGVDTFTKQKITDLQHSSSLHTYISNFKRWWAHVYSWDTDIDRVLYPYPLKLPCTCIWLYPIKDTLLLDHY